MSEDWQKSARLFRAAFADFTPPLDVDEVAGLACEAEIESRLVLEKGGAGPWALRHGPFTEADFAALPASHWTLLVQDVDKWIPAAADLLARFRFLPDWRIDDLMISVAADQGSVGPHWDDYDVFLIQGAGRREWRIDERPVAADNRLDGTPLRIMRDFETSQSWVLEPGDMLYLPPRLAHWGIARGDGCMTLSVGFRAPDRNALIEDYLSEQLAHGDPGQRFRDPPRATGANPGLIDPASIAEFQALIRTALPADTDAFVDWLGGFLTRAKPGIAPLPPDTPIAPDELPDWLAAEPEWRRDGATRIAFVPPGSAGATRLHAFVNGERLDLDDEARPLIEHLAAQTRYRGETLAALAASPATRALLTDLINAGHVHVDD